MMTFVAGIGSTVANVNGFVWLFTILGLIGFAVFAFLIRMKDKEFRLLFEKYGSWMILFIIIFLGINLLDFIIPEDVEDPQVIELQSEVKKLKLDVEQEQLKYKNLKETYEGVEIKVTCSREGPQS